MVFLGDIAFYMATLVFAVGIYMIHHACHHDSGKPCRLLKLGGYFVVLISLLGMLCSGYYWLKYYSQGAYNTPHSQHHSMMTNEKLGTSTMDGMGHCMGQMEGKLMDSSMMMMVKTCMKKSNKKFKDSDSEEMSKKEHESHH